ncbi:M15 family metallopeptidase [Candidatus Dependentiae bacterium]|nr:M15 family metallopeptidase [Candidatus Dependentiae bacterium]
MHGSWFKKFAVYLLATLLVATAQADVKSVVQQATTAYVKARKKGSAALDDLVNVAQAIPSIVLDIKYATDNNFTGKAVYTHSVCYLRRAVVDALKQVQQELGKQGFGLKIWDGYRPYMVQQKFWDLVPDPRYVGDPAKGSKHNRGAAVDLTIISLTTGKELTMPSAFDDFSEKAHRNYAAMSPEAAKNCRFLEDAMTKHGFAGLPTEWWHFDYTGGQEQAPRWQQFALLNVSFEELEQLQQQ